MTFADACTTWFDGLPDDLRHEVRTVVGPMPDWMTESLGRAGLAVIDAEMADGSTGQLMPTALAVFLADTNDDPAADGDGRDQRDRAADARDAALDQREAHLVAREARVSARFLLADSVRIDADRRDELADQRDAVADAWQRAASFDALVHPDDQYTALLQSWRSAALDRSQGRLDRSSSADDRSRLCDF